MIDRKIVFIGAGNMAYSCVSGFLKSNTVKGSNIGIYDIDISKFDRFAGLNINKFSDLGAAVLFADYIILAVKPQVITQCLEQIFKATDFSDKVFISFIAPERTYTYEHSDCWQRKSGVFSGGASGPAGGGQGAAGEHGQAAVRQGQGVLLH